MITSPLKLDGAVFPIPSHKVGKFSPLGLQRGNKGILHTAFLNKSPIHPEFFVSEASPLNGYCSYRLLYNNNDSLLVGVVFSSSSSITKISPYHMSVCNADIAVPDSFEPSFILEKSAGLIMFEANDSSILVIPKEVESTLLIRTI